MDVNVMSFIAVNEHCIGLLDIGSFEAYRCLI